MKDRILNTVICFLIKHCNVNAATVRAIIHKCTKKEIENYLKDY